MHSTTATAIRIASVANDIPASAPKPLGGRAVFIAILPHTDQRVRLGTSLTRRLSPKRHSAAISLALRGGSGSRLAQARSSGLERRPDRAQLSFPGAVPRPGATRRPTAGRGAAQRWEVADLPDAGGAFGAYTSKPVLNGGTRVWPRTRAP